MKEENNQTINQGTNAKKPMDKKMLIIIGSVVLILVILLVIFVIKPGGGTLGGGGGAAGEVEQKISLVGEDIGNGKILITATNTKKETYDVDFSATFYDANKEVLRVFEETIHAVPANGKSYHVIDTSSSITGDYTYETKITKETLKDSSKIFSDKFTASSTKLDSQIEVLLKNTSTQKVDAVQIAVVYYNANKIVGYTNQFISDFIGEMQINEVVYIPTDATGQTLKFDRHEVIITAYNHDKTN